jgi:hypothetical protein
MMITNVSVLIFNFPVLQPGILAARLFSPGSIDYTHTFLIDLGLHLRMTNYVAMNAAFPPSIEVENDDYAFRTRGRVGLMSVSFVAYRDLENAGPRESLRWCEKHPWRYHSVFSLFVFDQPSHNSEADTDSASLNTQKQR